MLLTLTGIGILGMLISYLYFSGIASPDRLFFGFNHEVLNAFSFFLLLFVFPVLSAGDLNTKKSIKKIYVHLLLLFGLGVILFIYSVLVYWERLALFNPSHTWFDYSIVATIIIVFTLSTLLFSVQNRERLWNFKILYAILILIGFLLSVASMIVYGGYIPDIEGIITWDMLLLIAGLLFFLGFIPLLMYASPNFRGLLRKLRFIWLIGVLGGLITFTLAGLVNAGIIEKSILLNIDWYAFFIFGSFFLAISLLLLAGAKDFYKTLYKLRFLWLITFFIGIILVIFSFVAVLPTSAFVYDAIGSFGLEMYFDISFMYGVAITIFSLIFICSIVYFETEESADSLGLPSASDLISESETTTGEMIAYLEIVQKSNEDIINQFKDALREDKFRPRVYESLIKRYQDSNRAVKTRLEKYKRKSPLVSEEKVVSSLFDEAIGTKPEVTTPAPSTPPVVPPKTTPTVPPMPPKTTPTVPPMPPKTTPPPTAMPSAPPSIAPMPSVPPPTPGITPEKSPQSPLDLIADARSTSIAELRGEMLKELRRLREIFKEE